MLLTNPYVAGAELVMVIVMIFMVREWMGK